MRHLKSTKKFKRTEEERKRLWIDLCSGLIKSGKIETFTARAKWFAPKFERLVTHVKKSGDDKALAFRRLRVYLSETDSRKMIDSIVPKLENRNGGYVRILKLDKDFNTKDKSIVLITE
ncbi:MAG: 50S ribosomal protein L17 [candidate division SR1 bacterium]|nr:50S ribosomal protein L17 [candidate division SR1 bacterium]